MRAAMRESWGRVLSFFRKKRWEHEFQEELDSHLAMLTDDHMKEGMKEAEARRQARLALGSLASARELHREARGLPTLDSLLQDLRYTWRSLKRDPTFAVVAVLILSLGIAANTTVFSVVHALLLKPLPFEDPGRLTWVANQDVSGESSGPSAVSIRGDVFESWRNSNQSFASLAAYDAFFGRGSFTLADGGEPERLVGVRTGEGFFRLLGVAPQIGRLFEAPEYLTDASPVAMISHDLWQRRFASDPNVLGRVVTLSDQSVTLVGILPAWFDFGSYFSPGSRVDLFIPMDLEMVKNWGNTLAAVGRLRAGVEPASAQADLRRLAGQWVEENPNQDTPGAAVVLLAQHTTGSLHRALIVLWCAVGVVMLIVCANLSNLLLARAASRQKEIAVRAALGAGRSRIVRQMLTESLVLSSLGAMIGTGLAAVAVYLLARTQAVSLPLLHSVEINGSVLTFSVLVATVTGLVFGILPALKISGGDLHPGLGASHRGASEGRDKRGFRAALVVAEVALAALLLVGAGLLLRSFLRLVEVDLGFRADQALAVRIDPGPKYETWEEAYVFFRDVLERVGALPGVESVTLADALPLDRNRSWGIKKSEETAEEQGWHGAYVRMVGPGYGQTLGVTLIAGREISEQDTLDSQPVVVVNQTLARALWPGENPIGRRVNISGDERTVVGVRADVRHSSLEEGAGNEMYLSIFQVGSSSVDVVVRTALEPSKVVPSLRQALRAADPSLPTAGIYTLQDLVDRAISPRRFFMSLLVAFAALALLLASVGIYGVISYSVEQRTREIGIRMALGATGAEVQRRVISATLRLAAVGVAIGVLGSLAVSRLLTALLFEVRPADPVTFLTMIVSLMAVALLAGYLPSRRASKTSPLTALRST